MAFNNYSTLGDGQSWSNGRFLKPLFVTPSCKTILLNMKRVIVQNQLAIFRLVCENEGVTFIEDNTQTPEKGIKIFSENTIHYGNIEDSNERCILLDAQIVSSNINSNGRFDNYQIRFTINTGAARNLDSAYEFATVYLTAIQTLIEAMNPQELVFEWNGLKYGTPKVAFGLNGDLSSAPTVINLNNRTGAQPELIFNFTVFPVRVRTIV